MDIPMYCLNEELSAGGLKFDLIPHAQADHRYFP